MVGYRVDELQQQEAEIRAETEAAGSDKYKVRLHSLQQLDHQLPQVAWYDRVGGESWLAPISKQICTHTATVQRTTQGLALNVLLVIDLAAQCDFPCSAQVKQSCSRGHVLLIGE